MNDRLRSFVTAMKGVGCCKCPENDPACLDYHHVDPSKKDFAMGTRVTSRGFSSLFLESSKCAVVCSNCHRKHHYYGDSMTFTTPDGAEIKRRLQRAVEAAAISERERATLWASWLADARKHPSPAR